MVFKHKVIVNNILNNFFSTFSDLNKNIFLKNFILSTGDIKYCLNLGSKTTWKKGFKEVQRSEGKNVIVDTPFILQYIVLNKYIIRIISSYIFKDMVVTHLDIKCVFMIIGAYS